MHYLRITDGKGKFGLSTESKLIIGFSFLTLGILLTVMEIKAFSFICYYKRNPEARRPRNTILGTYYGESRVLRLLCPPAFRSLTS